MARESATTVAKRGRILREKIKEKATIYLGGECIICGYNKCTHAFDFHHRKPESKKFAISVAFSNHYSWDRIAQELNKCDLLCANCHREVHFDWSTSSAI